MRFQRREYQKLMTRARQLFNYDPVTGVFTRKTSVKGRAAGTVAGGLNDKGYVCVTVDGVRLRGHRLAWAFIHGNYPDFEIDHKDRNRSNNAIDNLRPATRSQQIQNRDFTAYNTSGAVGVYQVKSGRWRARICKERKYIHLGYFDTREEASAAHDKAAVELFGEFAYVQIYP